MPNQYAQEAAEKAYKGLSDFANGYRMYGKLIGEELTRDHRLLQACVTGILLDMIKAMSEQDDNRVTLQNKAAVELCRKLQEVIGDYPQYL